MFRKRLISWYLENNRPLPWSKTHDPYSIWLREVILQQTRVEQGASYYQKFLNHYPTIVDLANSSLEEVFKDWEGLGYYSRAKNLHKTAQIVRDDYNGIFPRVYEEILSLKGIGEYTAAAISSFAYNEPYSVLDGNVFRVLSRYFGIDYPIDTTIGKKYFKKLAQECLDISQPAQYNQAIIDFGAVICKPAQPLCNNCPFSSECKALNENRILELPVKSKKIIKKNRYFNYLVLSHQGKIYIQQRIEKDIWQFLFQFPNVEFNDQLLSKEELMKELSFSVSYIRESKIFLQTLTHRKIHAKFFEIECLDCIPPNDWILVSKEELNNYGFPKIIKDYLTEK
jgi:A/G-specific adenine glycosylase